MLLQEGGGRIMQLASNHEGQVVGQHVARSGQTARLCCCYAAAAPPNLTRRARDTTHLHCPMMTVSPSLHRKQGEMCAEMLVWRFSYRWYLHSTAQRGGQQP